jgi:uncharacterized membrane-anchored protein YhcB (DUF1043 family)
MMNHASWVVALVAIVVAAVLATKTGRLQNELDRSNDALKSQEAQIAQLTSFNRELEQTAAKTKDIVNRLAKAKETVSTLTKGSKEPSAEPSAAAVPQTDQDAGAKTEPANPPNTDKSIQQKVAAAQIGAMTDMQYGKLFSQLNLPEDQKAAVRDKLVNANLEIQTLTASTMSTGNTPAKEYTRQKNAIEERLRDDLSKSLSSAQMAEWDAYQPNSDQNQYEILLDGQLTMLAPELAAENRATSKTVFAEELAAALTDFGDSDKPFTLSNFNDAQMTALQQGLQRMATTLDEEQYGHLERFVNMVADSFAAMSGQEAHK